MEGETSDLFQKMKHQGYNAMFYGPLDLLPVSTKFTIINPVNGARVGSDLDWSMQFQKSEETTLYTNEDVVRLAFGGCFWEMMVNGSGTYSRDQSIFPNNCYDRIGELFFAKSMTNEINAMKSYYRTFGTFEAVINILKAQLPNCATNAEICLLALNLKSNLPAGSDLNRALRLTFVALNTTEFLYTKWQSGVTIPIRNNNGLYFGLLFRTYPFYPAQTTMTTIRDDKNSYFLAMPYKPMCCTETMKADQPSVFIIWQPKEKVKYVIN